MADRIVAPGMTAAGREWVGRHAVPLRGANTDLDPVVEAIGEAQIVMLGEASHGTAEFYAHRANLTRRLIAEKGFTVVAIEGDWPDAYEVNRYVRDLPGAAPDARAALKGFRRFPTWMWRNAPTLAFVQWLREHNDGLGLGRPRAGFYGLDVYSLHASMEAVIRFLDEVDPDAAVAARERYACFAPFREDSQQYALSAHYLTRTCEEEMVGVLVDLLRRRQAYEAASSPDALFEAELNALAALGAERYYRYLVTGGALTWNIRDRHMVDTLSRIRDHEARHAGRPPKVVLWEHNTHIGDFRATHEGQGGHVNVGQLVRERYGDLAFSMGFGTYQGTVTAASAWDGPAEFKPVPPAREGSYEALFHGLGLPTFHLDLREIPLGTAGAWLHETHDERAIGVVYHPERERMGNYVPSRLADRYDWYAFFDTTFAVEPIDEPSAEPGLETYPSGL